MKKTKQDTIINYEQLKGLTSAQVLEKTRTEGANSLPSSKPKSFLTLALGVIREPMFILLVACGSLYLVLGDFREGIMLLCFVFVIMGIEFFQEKKTEKALDALKDMASPRALVIRNGVEKRIAGVEVLTDDLIVLQEGDRVPADATADVGQQQQVQEQRRRINAMLQDYELQRRLHSEQLKFEQAQTQQAAVQVPGNQTLGTQSQ